MRFGRNDYIGRTIETNPAERATDVVPTPDPKMEITAGNIARYARAQASSIVEGKVSLKVFNQRKDACVGCDARVLSTKLPDELGYCRACGCGVSDKSRLSKKLWIPKTTCPKNLWKAARGSRVEKLGKSIKTFVSLLDPRRLLR